MEKKQLAEAQEILEAATPEREKKMEQCFADLDALHEQYGDILTDCMAYLTDRIDMEEDAAPCLPRWFIVDDLWGTA